MATTRSGMVVAQLVLVAAALLALGVVVTGQQPPPPVSNNNWNPSPPADTVWDPATSTWQPTSIAWNSRPLVSHDPIPVVDPGKPNLIYDCSGDDDSLACVMQCPDLCPKSCDFSCSSCKSTCTRCALYPGTSCGDPSFTGGDGNTFYFHGIKDKQFCVVSDANLHINAHFIGNHNPAINRNFTWIQAIGVSFGDHRLYVGARKAIVWDENEDHMEISFDGEPVNIETANNARWVSKFHNGLLSVTRLDSVNTVKVELAGVFTVSASAVPITDEDSRIHNYGKTRKDSLVHLDLRFKFSSLTDTVDGVLGQTYRPDYVNKMDVTVKMPIMGGAPKYLSSGLFSRDCAVSKFRRSGVASRVATLASS